MATMQDQINIFVADGKVLNDSLSNYYKSKFPLDREKRGKNGPATPVITSSFNQNIQTSILPLYKSSSRLSTAIATLNPNNFTELAPANARSYSRPLVFSVSKWTAAFSLWKNQLPMILTLAQVNQGQAGQTINSFNQWASTYLGKF